MTYRVSTDYRTGIPQTAIPGGLQPRGIAMHWTAGVTGENGADATIRFFISAAQRNASYHVLVWWENRTFGVRWIVPPARAAHSLNPSPPTYSPTSEVRRILGDRWRDPNAACLAVSFCGMPDDLHEALKDSEFIDGYARLVRELVATHGLGPRPLFNHGWAQPTTRFDAGNALIPAIYAALARTEEPDVTIEPGANWERGRIGFLAGKTYVLVRRAPGDPLDAAQWTDRRTYTPASNSWADYDGPWVLSEGIERPRVRNGDHAGYFVSSNGDRPEYRPSTPATPQPVPDCSEAVEKAEDDARVAAVQEWREWLATAPAPPS